MYVYAYVCIVTLLKWKRNNVFCICSTFSHKGHYFMKNFVEEMCFDFLYKVFLKLSSF